MNKTQKIILIVLISIVVLCTLIGTLGIRLIIRHYAKQVTAELTPASTYFTEYDVVFDSSDSTQRVTHNGITVTIPEAYKEKEISLENTYQYSIMGEDDKALESVVFMAPYDASDMNLFSEENLAEMNGSFIEKYAVKQLMKGFEKLGHGVPDSAYNTLKSASLLTADDYSFWNWKQGFAYVVSGMLKNTIYLSDYNYIYETDDMCGFIHVRDLSYSEQDYNYYLIVKVYSTKDLGTEYGLLIRCNSLDVAYGIINSIVIE